MGWFELFDRLRLRTSLQASADRDLGSALEGWSLPGSQLRITDRGLAALYRGEILDAGRDYRADMFDLAGHNLARSRAPAEGEFHLDARLAGRPQQILFGADHGHGLIAWHLPSHATTFRLPLAQDAQSIHLAPASLASMLIQTLPVQAITSLSAWADSAQQAGDLLRSLAPWLTRDTIAIVRLHAEAAASFLDALQQIPASCVLVVPCTGAADHEGRGEDPTEVLICLEALSTQSSAEAQARAQAAPRSIVRETWNDKDRAWRSAAQDGVFVQQPLPGRNLLAGWTIGIVDDVPATPVGIEIAALQTTAYRAATGFDYVAEIIGAVVVRAGDATVLVPQDGPAVIDPALLPGTDSDAFSLAESAAQTQAFLAVRQLSVQGQFGLARSQPVRSTRDRTAFLLGTDSHRPRLLTEILPRLEYLFRQCEQDRRSLDDYDVLIPGGADDWLRAALLVLGIAPEHIVTDTDGVLFRRVLVVPPASSNRRAERNAAYDQFWTRLAAMRRGAGFVSFSQPRPAQRLYLTTRTGAALLNATRLIAAARAQGYHIVDVDSADFEILATQLAAARVIVGTAEALAWSVLARDCVVGALLADTATGLPHGLLHAAAARGHTVSVAFGSGIGRAEHGGFAVPPELLDTLIDRLERSLATASGAVSAAAGAAR